MDLAEVYKLLLRSTKIDEHSLGSAKLAPHFFCHHLSGTTLTISHNEGLHLRCPRQRPCCGPGSRHHIRQPHWFLHLPRPAIRYHRSQSHLRYQHHLCDRHCYQAASELQPGGASCHQYLRCMENSLFTVSPRHNWLTVVSQNNCINDMFRKAVDVMGCTQFNVRCYCSQQNVYFGMRDCSGQACGSDQQRLVLDWWDGVCAQNRV